MPLFRRRPPGPPADDRVVVSRGGRRVVEEEEVYEAPPPPRPPQLWPWLLLLALLVLGGLGALWYFSQEEDKETVPAVVGLSVDEATERLTADGFRTVVNRRASPRARGRVFAQTPGGGSQLEEGEAVELLVSTGPRLTTVPDVTDLTAEAAAARLRQAGLKERRRGVFAEEPRGAVVAQDPRAGERVARGASVRVNVSKGTGRVKVPDVLGQRAADAGANIRKVGLVAKVFNVPSVEPKGTVVAQNPQPGSELARGDTVRINVSSGEAPEGDAGAAGGGGGGGGGGGQPGRVPVPDVVGQRLGAAQDQLQDEGFVVRVVFVPSREPANTVVAQNPTAGTTARRGANVQVNVSEGPRQRPRASVPDVIGLTEQEARQELTRAGFTVRVFTEPTPDPAENELVVRQEPVAGQSAPRGSQITIYIGEFTG